MSRCSSGWWFDEVLFVPDTEVLQELELSSSESLLMTGYGGKFLVPLHNNQHNNASVEEQSEVHR